jgi:hypothetical protein
VAVRAGRLGVAGIGLVAALAAIVRRDVRPDLRIMAALAAGVTLVIGITAPAGLPPDQARAWVSGRYLDAMVVTLFLPGTAVLLRATWRQVLACVADLAAPTAAAAFAVSVYAGISVATAGSGPGFSAGELAVLTQGWSRASVALASVVAFALPAVWAGFVTLAGLAAVSLLAAFQMTSHVSRAGTPAQQANTTGLITGSGLRPGQQLAIGTGLSWQSWMPQAYELWWTQPQFFGAATQPPPSGADVVEVAWPAGRPARDSWPQAPAGWTVATSDRAAGRPDG